MKLRLSILVLSLAFCPAASADDAPPSASPAQPAPTLDPLEAATMQSFAAAHPQCVEWSDGCAVCKRDSGVHCSTPGIACQPHEIACTAP